MKLEKEQTVEGKITRIVEEALFVDVGAQREAVIPKVDMDQLKGNPAVRLAIGETIPVYIYYAPKNGENPLGSVAHALGIPFRTAIHQRKHGDDWDAFENEHQVGDIVTGTIKNIKKYGAFVKLSNDVDGLVHVSELETGYTKSPWNVVRPGEQVRVRILDIDSQKKRVALSLKDVDEANWD
jgi:small subunit ribosomal protein S1